MGQPREQNKQMLLELLDWPLWPMLPVKRYQQQGAPPQFGIVFAGHGSKVYLANMTDVPTKASKVGPYKLVDFDKMECIAYDDVDALLNDNWEVD